MGISFSFDGDLLFIGDAYKNFSVLQMTDKEELMKREKVEDADKFIQVKRLCSNKMNEKVVGVYTLRGSGRTE